MRREERAPTRTGSSSAQRRQSSVPRGVDAACPGPRPPSRITESGVPSPPPESSYPRGRPSPPLPSNVYGISQAQEAKRSGSRGPGVAATPGMTSAQRTPSTGTAAQRTPSTGSTAAAAGAAIAARRTPSTGPTNNPVGSNASKRVSSAGGNARSAAVRSGGHSDLLRTPVFSYLKVFGLNQYARAFVDVGLDDLECIGRLSETEALEFLERLRVYPGHRLRLLRAIDCLRHAALGAERRDASQMLEDDAALERLCAQNEKLTKVHNEAEDENKRLHKENSRLVEIVRAQDAQLQKANTRIAELEDMVQEQTEEVGFLAQQLQQLAQKDPAKENELYRSYRDSYDDWGDAEQIELPEATKLPAQEGGSAHEKPHGEDLNKPRSFTPHDFKPALPSPARTQHAAPASAPMRTSQDPTSPSQTRRRAKAPFSPPRKARLARSLDSAQIKECLAGFDVDHVLQCLATALQNKLILSAGKPRPHASSSERLADCAVFLEPACLERLRAMAAESTARPSSPASDGTLSLCSPLMARCTDPRNLTDSMGKPTDPLNNLAVRNAPIKWDIYGFLRDVMYNFRLEPEVSVITLFYINRFSDVSGVAYTPDNWQRLTITAMMLASKVWNDESFENYEFAQLCPLYALDEINTFERIFLKCVGYNMSVKGSEYATTYFLLRTLGAKDSADFGLEPLDALRASRLTERCLNKQLEFRQRYPDDADQNMMNWTL